MVVLSAQATPTARVTARLQAEGWVECSNLGFPALSQTSLSNLHHFILSQLRNAGGRMWEQDLKLNALVFSISTHQFEVHPQLPTVLHQMAAEGLIDIRPESTEAVGRHKPDVAIILKQ
ncbi:MAG TPA: hypothetical protein V6C78_28865 [Crinalium sp.]|jgi:hypothetical protein